ncbi:YlzJ-like family protein [Thermoactinomyces sp. DSM 45892]|uniref:YlzJ-like family protein n=1 Tax=Thermoactinomyces sp. DSM 45892 TaxID=1882753 RepID=UPI000897A2A9|nr:YlzJ-like family protein [Thermoactinomyces sp. DSM 45892]SDY48382.1 YlzJ-like protein [Thermoactinomyces sp. DSM 45892]
MIHWTVLPSNWDESEAGQIYQPHFQECTINGIQMVIEILPSGKAQINRLLSPNPQDYLNPKYQPGTELTLHPMLESTYSSPSQSIID